MKRLLFITLVCSLAFAPAFGQGVRYSNTVFSTGGFPFATIRVCSEPSSGTPCTPLATVYSDPALTQPIIQPFSADSNGNFAFFGNPAITYHVQVSGPGMMNFDIPYVTLPNGTVGSGTVTSVGFNAPSGFNVSGGPITVNGTVTLAMPTGWVSGDMLIGSGLNTVSRLPVGSNGNCLLVVSLIPAWGTCPGSGTITGVTAGSGLSGGGSSGAVTLDITNPLPAGVSIGGAGTLNIGSGGTLGTFAFQSYSTPPAIGGVTPAAGTFTTLATTNNAAFGGNGPFTDVTALGVTTGTQSASALNAAIAGCSGGTLWFPPSLGTATFTSQITVSAGCTLKAEPGTVTIKQGYNSGTTATSGLVLVSANNVAITGLTILGNSGTNTGRVVTLFNASSQVTHVKLQNLSVTGCDKACLRIDGANDVEVASSRLQGVNTEYPLYLQSSNNSLQDIKIHDNIVDGTSIVNGNHGALELEAAGTDIDIGPNNVIYGGDWYGGEIGLFTDATIGVGVLKNFNFHDNHVIATQSGNHGGISFGGLAPPCSISHNTIDGNQLPTGGGQGFELNGVVGCTVDGNVFNLDSTGTINGIWGDNPNDLTITHNVINGFGTNGGAGIVISGAQSQQALTSCSVSGGQPPYLITCSLNNMPFYVYNGEKVYLSGNSPATYNGFFTIISRTGTNGSSGTFSFYVPGAPGSFVSAGTVGQSSSNNLIADNQVIFPVFGTRTPPIYGIGVRCGISSTTSICNNNSFRNNFVQGTGISSGELGLEFIGVNTGTQDSNSAEGNTFINLATGINRSNGTNSRFEHNRFINVTTPWNGSAQTGEITQQIDPVAASNLNAGFGSTASVTGNTSSFTITASGTGQTTTPAFIGLTPAFATGLNCWITDQTTPAKTAVQTASTTAGATFTFSSAPSVNDVLRGGCSSI